MLKQVVDKLSPESSEGSAPQGGYMPRVFAFEGSEGDKDAGSGGTPAGGPGPGGTGSPAPAGPVPPAPQAPPPAAKPPARPIAKLKPLTGAIARVVNPNANRPPQQGATPPPLTVPPASIPPGGAPPAGGPPGGSPAGAPPAGSAPAGAPPMGGAPAGPPASSVPAGPPAGGPPGGGVPAGPLSGGPRVGPPPAGGPPPRGPRMSPPTAGMPMAGSALPPPPGSVPPGGASGAGPFPPSAVPPHGAFPPGPGHVPPSGGKGPLGGKSGGRGPRIALASGLVAVALFALLAIIAGVQADSVPSGTTVAGVDIGGKSRDEAVAALDAGLAKRAKQPVAVVAGEAQSKLNPAKAGLAIDAEATVDELTGYSLNPVRMWQHVFGADEAELMLDVDEKKLKGAVSGLTESMLVKPADGAVEFADGVPRATDARQGSSVDAAGARAMITDNWLRSEPPFTLPTQEVAPEITQEEVDRTVATAEKVISASVAVEVDGQSVELTPADLAAHASFQPKGGRLHLRFDQDGLVEIISERASGLITIPEDAHFEFQGGRPVVVGGDAGTTLDGKRVEEKVKEAAKSDKRVARVELVEQDPENTKEALRQLGVKEIVSEFSTPLTSDDVRTQNLIRGAQMITGVLVKPEETFSLIEALSPITEANGYVASGIVSNGQHVEGVGGGLSQMATTSYNAGYFAGFDDVEHRQHSFWFPRYPAGREATIYVGALDMKFYNDTPYGAVLESFVSDGQLTVRIWSTKYYQVETSDSGHKDVVETSPVKSTDAECVPYPGGEDGFTITNFRRVFLNGELVKDEQYPWTYKPDNPVECTKDKGDGKD